MPREQHVALTLLVENNPKIIEIYLLNLATYVGLEIMVAKSLAEAQKKLAEHPIELVVTRARLGQDEVAQPLVETLRREGRSMPVFVIGHGLHPRQIQGLAPNGLDVKSVVRGAAQALGITAQQMAQRPVQDFFAIPVRYFSWVSQPVCDVYRKDARGVFQLLIKAHEPLQSHHLTLDDFLFVGKLDRLQAVNQITAELVARLEDKDLNPDEVIAAASSNQQLLTHKLLSLGLTEETIALAQKSMVSMTRQVKHYPKLGLLLQRMLANKTSLLYRHTQIVTYVSLHIVRHIDWGTPEQEEKIAFISFFHDIALENDEQALIHGREEFRTASFDTRERSLVERHAQLAAELVLKYPHAPMGADQIIRQHHGMLNGVGFSDHFGANLSPMAIVFVVAEEFTRILLRRESGPFDVKELLRELRLGFPTARFQKIIDLLEGLSV